MAAPSVQPDTRDLIGHRHLPKVAGQAPTVEFHYFDCVRTFDGAHWEMRPVDRKVVPTKVPRPPGIYTVDELRSARASAKALWASLTLA